MPSQMLLNAKKASLWNEKKSHSREKAQNQGSDPHSKIPPGNQKGPEKERHQGTSIFNLPPKNYFQGLKAILWFRRVLNFGQKNDTRFSNGTKAPYPEYAEAFLKPGCAGPLTRTQKNPQVFHHPSFREGRRAPLEKKIKGGVFFIYLIV